MESFVISLFTISIASECRLLLLTAYTQLSLVFIRKSSLTCTETEDFLLPLPENASENRRVVLQSQLVPNKMHASLLLSKTDSGDLENRARDRLRLTLESYCFQ